MKVIDNVVPEPKPDGTFRVLYSNVGSILNKINELSAYAFELKPDLITICETWGNQELNDAFFTIPGYEVICRNDRTDTTGGIGGGLMIYARNDMVGNVSELKSAELDSYAQASAIKVRAEGNEITLVLLYRPHHIYQDKVTQTDLTTVNNEKLCQLLHNLPKPYVIVGDLNYSNIDWETMSTTDSRCKAFIQAVQDNFVSQHINFATHNSGTQPDVILSSNSENVLDVEELCHLGSSDHTMIMTTLEGTVSRNVTFEEVPDWRKADLSRLRNELDIEWQFDGLNTLEAWDLIKNEIRKAEDKSVPKKRRRISCRPLWMQQNIMRVIRKKRRLWATYKKSKQYEEYLAYKAVEKETKKLVLQAKKKFEKKLAKEAKKKPKMFYSYLRSKTSNRSSVGPLKDNDLVVSQDTGMANVLNKFFVSVFTVENDNLPDMGSCTVPEKLEDVFFPEDAISEKIGKLKADSAFGPDKIGPRILKATSDVLCAPLSVVFTKSLQEGVVPDDWRRQNITPIFKSGSRMMAGNYRPVALTSIVCKIMESILRDNIIAHLVKFQLIKASQHGFMSSKSCQTNLIEYLDTLTRLVDEGYNVDVIYLDFAKAFDKVPHRRLVLKMEQLGISGNVLRWIQGWLTGRQQRVVLNGSASEWMPVTSGVPQGSVLGPTCFVIFINDLDDVLDLVNGFVSKFADDTKYGRIIRNEEDHQEMQRNIDKLSEWAETWQMDFNSKKCKIMHFGNKNPKQSYCMGGYAPAGTVLQVVSEEKDIGVIVSDDLKPSSQCGKAVKKANSILGQMSRSFLYRDKDVWIHLYKMYVRHHLEFSIQAWSPWYIKDVELLEKVQERAVNMVTGLRSKTYEGKLRELNLPSLYDRRIRGDLIQTWKYLHHHNPGGEKLFKMAGDQHQRLSRHTQKPWNIAPTNSRLEVRRNFYTSRCVEKWNMLPHGVQDVEALNEFKNAYDKFVRR